MVNMIRMCIAIAVSLISINSSVVAQWEAIGNRAWRTDAMIEINGLLVVCGLNTIQVSSDGGHSWKDGTIHYDNEEVGHPDSLLVAATSDGTYVFVPGTSPLRSEGEGRKCVPSDLEVQEGNLFLSDLKYGVFRSMDGGNNWEQPSGLPFDRAYCIASVGDYLFVGTNDKGVFRSSDAGTSWKQVATGLPEVTYRDRTRALASVMTIASDEDQLLVGTDRGLFRSRDVGEHWSRVEAMKDTGVTQLYVSDNVILLAPFQSSFMPCRIYRSTDHGITWRESVVSNLRNSVGKFYGKGNDLLIGSYDGVYRSTDSGATWNPYNEGLPTRYYDWSGSYCELMPVDAFATRNGYIYLASNDGQLYRRLLDTVQPGSAPDTVRPMPHLNRLLRVR